MANIFPKWSNKVPAMVIIGVGLLGAYACLAVTYYFTPKYTRTGYMPKQPVAYDHSLHAGQLGIDCRYCHSHVEESGHANIPDAATCMNCHSVIRAGSPALAPIRESAKTGEPVKWVRVHEMPDYVYFNHSVHVNRGISCVECHGRVDQMEEVYHAKPFSMAFCLDCHRNPEGRVRPLDKVYDLGWEPKNPQQALAESANLIHDWQINPPQSCSGCHR